MNGFEKRNRRLNRLKFIFTSLNFLILLSSLFLIGFSVDYFVNEYQSSVMKNDNTIILTSIIFITLAFAIFIFVIFGFFSVITLDKKLLQIYICASLFISLINGIIGCYCFVTNINLSLDNTRAKLSKALSQHYGDDSHKSLTEAWDFYQQQFSCCGVTSEIDYISTQWFKKQQPTLPRKRRPLSCCPSCEQLFSHHCLPKNSQILTTQPTHTQPFIDGSKLHTEECLTILHICSFNSSYPFSDDMCHGNLPIPPGVPISFLLHTNGCLKVIHEKDKRIVEKFIIISWFYSILNAINASFVLFIYQRVFIKHAYSTISLDL